MDKVTCANSSHPGMVFWDTIVKYCKVVHSIPIQVRFPVQCRVALLWRTFHNDSWVIYTSGRCRGSCRGRCRDRCLGHLHLTTVLLLREFFICFLQKQKTRKRTEIYKRIGKGKTPLPRCHRTSTTVETG